MSRSILLVGILTAFGLLPSANWAQDVARLETYNEALRISHSLCITQGRLDEYEITGEASGGFALKRLGLGGEATVVKRSSTLEGLANGIDAALADQQLENTMAARDCMTANFFRVLSGLLNQTQEGSSLLPELISPTDDAVSEDGEGNPLETWTLSAFLQQFPFARLGKVTWDEAPLVGTFDVAVQELPGVAGTWWKTYGFRLTLASADGVAKALRTDVACSFGEAECNYEFCVRAETLFRSWAAQLTNRILEYSDSYGPTFFDFATRDGKPVETSVTWGWKGMSHSTEVRVEAEFDGKTEFPTDQGLTATDKARCSGFIEIIAMR